MPRREPAEPHRAKKSLGQNFLVDPNIQRKIVAALDPSPNDEVLEIGPGRGALTRHLAGKVGRLLLVELDDHLAAQLQQEFATDPTVEVHHENFLDIRLADLTPSPAQLKVIGNIPYNITTPILFHLLENRPRPALIVLMVQREVADRILAEPGGKTYGALAVGIQAVAAVERVLHVGRSAFRPAPDVDSTVIRLTPFRPPRLDESTEAALRTLTREAFGRRRKQLQRILRDAFSASPSDLERLSSMTSLDLQDRPETLSSEDFIQLTRALRHLGLYRG